jgi:hypothetical protein
MRGGRFHEDFSGHAEIRGSSNRNFGLIVGGALLVIGLLPLIRGGRIRIWAIALGAVLALLAVAAPRSLAPLNRAWTKLGLLLGKVVNPVVLSLLYLIGFTPMAVLMRAFGKDPLRLKLAPSATTYWISRSEADIGPESMRRQF